MTTLRMLHTHARWSFWIQWMLASIAGVIVYGLALTLLTAIVTFFAFGGAAPTEPFPPWLGALNGAVSTSALGAALGLAQWLVLRRVLRGTGWWVAATAAGYAMPFALGWTVPAAIPGWLVGALIFLATGAVLGMLQWLVLRRHVAYAGWWSVLSVCGWLLAYGVTGLAVVSGLYIEPFDMLAAFIVPVAVAGTGLVWLLPNTGHA